jgi:hypothetical protein
MTAKPRFALVFAAVLACGVAAYLLAPWLIARRVESQLADMGEGYRGSFDAIELRALSAEIAIVGLRVERVKPRIETPFLEARELVIGIVRNGTRLHTVLRAEAPTINWIDARNDALDQWGPPFELAKFREDLPFDLTDVKLRDATLHLRAFDADPEVDVYLKEANVHWRDLAGCLPPGGPGCRSELTGRATAVGNARLTLRGSFDRKPESHFVVEGKLTDLAAKALSPLLLRYAKLDVTGGSLDLEARYALRGRRYTGLFVPRLHDLEVMGGDRQQTRFGRELGLAMVAGYFERRRGEKAIRIEGTKGKDDFDYEVVDNPLAQRGADARR